MTISNESRGRIKKIFEPIALGDGPARPDTRTALTLIGFAITDGRRDPDRRSRRGSSAASSSSSAASSTCSTARWRARPARPARSARSWTRPSTSCGEILVFLGCIAGAGDTRASGRCRSWWPPPRWAPSIMVSYTRAKSDGLGYLLGHGPGRGRHHAPRDPPRHHLARHRPHRDEHRHLGHLEFALGIILVGAVITVIQRILHVRSQADRQPPITTTHRSSTENT